MSLNELFSILKGGSGSGNFNHSGVPGHLGGSAPTGGVSKGSAENIKASKSKMIERGIKLGYSKIAFEKPNKNGLIQVVATQKGKPKKLNLFINPEGKIVDKTGKESLAFKD